ncbi:iron ABC transporter ATP-binding protein [Salisediminibacterium beveridgei]|uniref:Putative iron compound ABC uptake transporter, ATP-binding protein n=1 Tax=Salisediminibacterium beveridgei TaxID=632773 RepID=A0A1D7QXK4_9BACI|nr:ATP-binding cassette domain-containing protein [Salisediminibacterium beveridgei]AOM83740.1 putative iron compound ABC uptake transporter, ATP-binding protein [Salisediminibacterium beveridgei]
MLEALKLFKSYRSNPVVKDVSVSIQKGTITTFIGPNGAGKSTLLSMVSRLITSDHGQVSIDGQSIKHYKDRDFAKKVAILKQSNFMNVRLTIRDLVSFGRFPYSQGYLTEEDWEKVDEAIDYLELGDMQDQYLDELSGGQRQRAFIAMVLAQDTDYILLDEPLNNLDMKHSVQIMKVLRKMVDELGKTVVLVIHDINFASCYSDYIVAMKHGKVIKEGYKCDVIQSGVLKKIYDLDFHVQEINNQQICVYFS